MQGGAQGGATHSAAAGGAPGRGAGRRAGRLGAAAPAPPGRSQAKGLLGPCLRHSVWTRHPCRGAGTPAEGQAPLQRGSAASGQTALCACQWRAGVPSGRRSQHCMAEVCIHRCFCRLCGPGRNACGAAGQQLCWRCCKGLCQGRKPCTVSLNSVLYCARRANAGRGQGAAALSAHMREANQFLNAALVLCNALNQVRPGMTAGVVGSILDQLCSALPVLLVRC